MDKSNAHGECDTMGTFLSGLNYDGYTQSPAAGALSEEGSSF
jgi:hypothetical protein